MNIEDIQAPEWANKGHTAINCRVKFAEFNEFLPFTACPNDLRSMDAVSTASLNQESMVLSPLLL